MVGCWHRPQYHQGERTTKKKKIKTDENPYPQSTMNIQAEEKSSHKISFDGSIKNGHWYANAFIILDCTLL